MAKDSISKKPEVRDVTSKGDQNTIAYWTRHSRWPRELFQPDEKTRNYLNRDPKAESCFNNYLESIMNQLLAKK